jgi:hypothetical protein
MLKMSLNHRVLKSLLSALTLSVIAAPAFAEEIEIEVKTAEPDMRQEVREEIEIIIEKEKSAPTTYPRLFANAELGFVSVLGHSIQFSKNNSTIDYVKEGGQDNLFNLAKLSLDLELDPHHKVVFLYQPLSFNTRAVIGRDVTIDNVAFPAGTPMTFLYDFPFFRGSYLYDFDPDPKQELAAGLSLQLRDAVIEFASLNGEKFVSNRNVGPVPILKFRSKHYFDEKFWWGSEVDGFYAPVSLLNGSTNEVIGAILDANMRAGWDINDQNAVFVNLRYIGGGAVGTSDNAKGQGDGFSENWFHTLGLTLGVRTGLF